MRKIPCISFVAIYILLFVVSANAQLKTPPVIEWQKSLGGSNYDGAASIQQTLDGGFILWDITTSTVTELPRNHGNMNYWFVKLNITGIIVGQSSLGGSYDDRVYSIQQTADGGYIVAGYSYSIDGNFTGQHDTGSYPDCWIVKLNDTGAIVWQRSLGGSHDDQAFSIQQTNDGGYITAGWSQSTDGDITTHHGSSVTQDYWVVKMNDTGAIQWQRSLGGSRQDIANSVRQTIDGGYIVVGTSKSIDGDVSKHIGSNDSSDCWIVKLSENGEIDWQKSLGGGKGDVGYSIQLTMDGGYIVGGSSSSNNGDVTGNHGDVDYWVVKLNDTGAIEWQRSLGGRFDDQAYCIQQTKDG